MIAYVALSLGPAFLTAALIFGLGWSVELACAIGIVASLTAVILGEIATESGTTFRTNDLAHALLSSVASQACIVAAVMVLGSDGRAASTLPLTLQVAVIVLGSDFLGYWAHRAQHRVELLWRAHVIHHTPTNLYWLNGLRAHPADAVWAFLVATLWALVLGFSPVAFGLSGVIITSHLLIQHTRVRFHARLSRLVVTPQWHELHHDLAAKQGVNLGKVVTVWDRMFGTYRPIEEQSRQLGVESGPSEALASELLYPFIRAR